MHFREVYFACRKSAIEKFDKAIPMGKALMEEMEDYLGRLYSRLSEISLTGEKEHHRLPLIISYIRTHFVIDELLRYCENIEAATLVRKQLEVLARYKETDNLQELRQAIKQKKVPQMGKVKNGGKMYGMLSEIAHSAKPETYTLLGYEKQENGNVGINLFGVYNENVKVTFGIHIDVFCRFFSEMLTFQQEHVTGYSDIEDMEWMSETFIPLGFESGIRYFDRYKD